MPDEDKTFRGCLVLDLKILMTSREHTLKFEKSEEILLVERACSASLLWHRYSAPFWV